MRPSSALQPPGGRLTSILCSSASKPMRACPPWLGSCSRPRPRNMRNCRRKSTKSMPGHEPGIDFVDLRLQLRIFLGLGREQLPSQGGQALIGLDALEQRIEVSLPPGGCKAELGRIAADGVGQLRAIADQPVTYADQYQGRLLLSRLHRHEAHRRPARRLAKRFRVRRIVLAALDVRLAGSAGRMGGLMECCHSAPTERGVGLPYCVE